LAEGDAKKVHEVKPTRDCHGNVLDGWKKVGQARVVLATGVGRKPVSAFQWKRNFPVKKFSKLITAPLLTSIT
jgi:hypothetical protein